MDFYFMYNRLLSVTFSSTHTHTKSATQFVITITYIYKSQFGKTSPLKLWLSFFCQGLFDKAEGKSKATKNQTAIKNFKAKITRQLADILCFIQVSSDQLSHVV